MPSIPSKVRFTTLPNRQEGCVYLKTANATAHLPRHNGPLEPAPRSKQRTQHTHYTRTQSDGVGVDVFEQLGERRQQILFELACEQVQHLSLLSSKSSEVTRGGAVSDAESKKIINVRCNFCFHRQTHTTGTGARRDDIEGLNENIGETTESRTDRQTEE